MSGPSHVTSVLVLKKGIYQIHVESVQGPYSHGQGRRLGVAHRGEGKDRYVQGTVGYEVCSGSGDGSREAM